MDSKRFFILLSILLFSFSAGAQTVTNGQFYDGLTGWTILYRPGNTSTLVVNPTVWIPNPPGYGLLDGIDSNGDYSVENYWVGSNYSGSLQVALSQVISLSPGTKYVASALFGGDGEPATGEIYIASDSWTDFGQGETKLAEGQFGENAWGTLNGVFTAAASSQTLIIQIFQTGNSVPGVDCVSVVEHVPVVTEERDNMNGLWSFWCDEQEGADFYDRASPVVTQYQAPWAGWRGPWSGGTWNAAKQGSDAWEDIPGNYSLRFGCIGNGGGGVSRNFINLTPGEYRIELDVQWGPGSGADSWVAYEINRTNFYSPDLLSDGIARQFAQGDSSGVWQSIASPPFTIENEDDSVTFWAYNDANGYTIQIDNVAIVKAVPTAPAAVEGWKMFR